MVEDFGDEVGQRDAQKRSGGKGEGAADKMSAGFKGRCTEPENECSGRACECEATVDNGQTSRCPAAGIHN